MEKELEIIMSMIEKMIAKAQDHGDESCVAAISKAKGGLKRYIRQNKPRYLLMSAQYLIKNIGHYDYLDQEKEIVKVCLEEYRRTHDVQ